MNAREMTVHKVPDLFSVEAEQVLLGAVMMDHVLFWRVSDHLTSADFYDPLHARIWTKIVDLMARDLRPTAVSLTSAMASDAGLMEVGQRYLENIAYAAPTGAPVVQYANEIANLGRRRRIVEAATAAIDAAYFDRETAPDQIATALGEATFDATHRPENSGAESILDITRRAAEAAENARRNPERARVTTGIPLVDQQLGGLFPRELHVLGAQSSMGKSGLVAQMCRGAAHAGYVTLIFSIEMSAEEIGTRYLATDVAVPANRISEGRTSSIETQRIAEATVGYQDMKLFVDATSKISVAQMRARCQAIRRKHGGLDLIAVDHLRLVRGADPKAREHERLDQITQDLKALAKDLNLAVLLVSPLNRDGWQRNSARPVLSDLYGASAIEYNADHVWFLHREEFYLDRNRPDETDSKSFHDWRVKMEAARGKAEFFGAKRRGGPLGSAMLKFDAPLVQFHDPADNDPDAQGLMI